MIDSGGANGLGLFDLSERGVLVTGAGRGLGRDAALALAAHGAAVAVVDLDGDAAEQVAEELRRTGAEAVGIQCDVADVEAVDDCVRRVLRDLGQLDVLVANAGIGDRAPAEALTPAQWQRVLSVNLDGVWFFDQAVGRHLIDRGASGSLINMASIAGLVGVSTGNANYAASKGGVIALTRCLAVEWAPHGIRVNAIAPTHFRTPLIEGAMQGRPDMEDYFLGNIPLGRLGRSEEIHGPVVFLASDAASMVTGHVLAVDGGHTAV